MDKRDPSYSLEEAARELGITVAKLLRLAAGCSTKIRHEVVTLQDSFGGVIGTEEVDIEPDCLVDIIEHPERRHTGYIIPAQLVKEVREKKYRTNQVRDRSTRDINTVFTIFLGMASLCGYNPKDVRNSAVPRIAKRSRTDPKTVRHWLNEAATRVDWPESG
ncbi:MAG: hypothetical protein ACREX4_19185 [Gammaproteobacteria bacterium]